MTGKLRQVHKKAEPCRREIAKTLTFMPNNPAIKAPIPIPMVPMDTFETELTFREKWAVK